MFLSYNPSLGHFKIKIVDGSLSSVAGIGSIYLLEKNVLKKSSMCPNYHITCYQLVNSLKI